MHACLLSERRKLLQFDQHQASRGRGEETNKKRGAEFLFVVMNAQCDGGGRILLGDNKAAGRSCCGRSGSSVLGCGFQLDCLIQINKCINIYTYSTICTNKLRFAQNSD